MTTSMAAANIFADFFASNRSQYEIDLSNKSLQDVISIYQDYKRKTSPGYTVTGLQYNLRSIEALSGHVIKPYEVTDLFYATFAQFLAQKGLKSSTIENYFGHLKCCLTWATKHNCRVSSSYDVTSVSGNDAFTIALTPDDVSHIAHFDVGKLKCRSHHKKNLEKVRDMFVLACNLGQRYSDMVRITPENFNRNIFSCTQQKTGNKARVDIDALSITPSLTYKILDKYNHSSPCTLPINKYNELVHELVRLIGEEFNEEYKVEQKVGGVMQIQTVKKWELISSHTARRTFISYNTLRGIPMPEVMRASGHKSLSCVQKYIKFQD